MSDVSGQDFGLLIAQLRSVEDRLERILASGWRNAAAESARLGDDATALRAVGLEQLASRLSRVVAAGSAAGALSAIAMARSTVRLIRAQIPADGIPPGVWSPYVTSRTRVAAETVVPVCRFALAGRETWAAVRLHAGSVIDWLLADPLPTGRPPPWLRLQLRTQLRWQGRYPVGSMGEVRHCSLHDVTSRPFSELTDDPVQTFRDALTSDRLHDGLPIFNAGESLRLRRLDPTEAASYVWLDPRAEATFRETAEGPVWALAWQQEAVVVPLAILRPRQDDQPAQIVHLIVGRPTEPLFGEW
jgi:hypothetical protein